MSVVTCQGLDFKAGMSATHALQVSGFGDLRAISSFAQPSGSQFSPEPFNSFASAMPQAPLFESRAAMLGDGGGAAASPASLFHSHDGNVSECLVQQLSSLSVEVPLSRTNAELYDSPRQSTSDCPSIKVDAETTPVSRSHSKGWLVTASDRQLSDDEQSYSSQLHTCPVGSPSSLPKSVGAFHGSPHLPPQGAHRSCDASPVQDDQVSSSSFSDMGDDSDDEGADSASTSPQKTAHVRKGLSTFFLGKSRSFTSLADVATIRSINELAKPHRPQQRKIRKSSVRAHLRPRIPARGCLSMKGSKEARSPGFLGLALAMEMKEAILASASLDMKHQPNIFCPKLDAYMERVDEE